MDPTSEWNSVRSFSVTDTDFFFFRKGSSRTQRVRPAEESNVQRRKSHYYSKTEYNVIETKRPRSKKVCRRLTKSVEYLLVSLLFDDLHYIDGHLQLQKSLFTKKGNQGLKRDM